MMILLALFVQVQLYLRHFHVIWVLEVGFQFACDALGEPDDKLVLGLKYSAHYKCLFIYILTRPYAKIRFG